MTRYISCADTAKLVRKALKESFPGIKFSVRSSSYAGGASIRVEWLDGPCNPDVDKVLKRFQGANFDSSTDCTNYHTSELDGEEVRFGANYVNGTRKTSRTFVEAIVQQFCERWGMPLLKVKDDGESAWVDIYALDHGMEHMFRKLLHDTDAKDMRRAYVAQEEREQRAHILWEQEAPERERRAQEQAAKEQREEAERLERVRRAREQREQAERQYQERARSRSSVPLVTKQQALAYLGLPPTAGRQAVMEAFREKVRASADGKGGYTEDMDLLVKAKEKALL